MCQVMGVALTREQLDEAVYGPSHYDGGGIETVEVMEGIVDGLPTPASERLAQVLKYAMRAGKKGSEADAAIDIAKGNNWAHRLVTGAWRDPDAR